jgi:protein-tyrosine phosphatase
VIDLHCHILPGLDDGASSLAEAVAMGHQAEADGIEVVCATPHIRRDHDVRISDLAERVAELNRALVAAGVTTRVDRAGEVAAPILDSLDDSEVEKVAIGARWVLLEPLPGPLDERLLSSVATLADRGFRALVAHPERHPSEHLRTVLGRAIEGGALVQATAAFVAAGPASEALVELFAAGLVHVLGSDCHSARVGRPLHLSPALDRLRRDRRVAPHLDWIAQVAPASILEGADVEVPISAR